MSYIDFLTNKLVQMPALGVTPAWYAAPLKDFQRFLLRWTLEQGRAAVFAERGLGKALLELVWAEQVANYTGQKALILAPLAVTWQIEREGQKFGIPAAVWDGSSTLPDAPVVIANYEKVERLAELGLVAQFGGVALDESSILKSFMGKTKMLLVETFRGMTYKLAATATPSPNDIVEIGNHAEFLEVMEPGEMLTRWFINDTTNAQTFRLKRHGAADFYRWLSTWAVALRLPSDLNPAFSDEGYVRPKPGYHVHTVKTDHSGAVEEQGALFRQVSASATSLHKELRLTLTERAAKVAELVNAEPEEPWVVWVHTNAEADAIMALLPDALEVRGDMAPEVKKADGLLYKNIRENAAKNRQGVAEHVVVFRKWGPGMTETPRVTHAPAEFTLEMWQKYASPVWDDIRRTDVLNARIASTDDDEKHLAPLQLEVIRRCVQLWTNPGELVFTPFLGVGSEAVGAIQVGRRAEGVELKPEYFQWAVKNVRQEADKAATQLFGMVGD